VDVYGVIIIEKALNYLMLVNVHEQIYIIRYRECIFCYDNEIETCHNCNLLYFKYSTVSIHKLSRVIFLDPVFIDFNLLLLGLLFGSIPLQ